MATLLMRSIRQRQPDSPWPGNRAGDGLRAPGPASSSDLVELTERLTVTVAPVVTAPVESVFTATRSG